ncbi:MAG TPA: NADPH-dependent FMN reductase [Ramlibacter sp.]|nr:NADPH-dependent FMN reductase [Ramlibacter sp.]
MSILLIAGSPSERSRSAVLLDAVARRLKTRLDARAVAVERLHIRDLSPQALLLADTGNAGIARAVAQVERARVLVVATPVYKAAYSGVLKVFLDLLPQSALKGKTVLPLATGGSTHHMLALDYALRPVLQSLAARLILPGVYATEAQLPRDLSGEYGVTAEIGLRLDDAVNTLLHEELQRQPSPHPAPAWRPLRFDQVRCSV